jgi:hypothetical protein
VQVLVIGIGVAHHHILIIIKAHLIQPAPPNLYPLLVAQTFVASPSFMHIISVGQGQDCVEATAIIIGAQSGDRLKFCCKLLGVRAAHVGVEHYCAFFPQDVLARCPKPVTDYLLPDQIPHPLCWYSRKAAATAPP